MACGPKFAVTVRYGGADQAGSNGDVYVRLGDTGGATGEAAVHLPGDPTQIGREQTFHIDYGTALDDLTELWVRVDSEESTWTLAAIDWFQVEDLDTHTLWQSTPVPETEQGFAAAVVPEETGSADTVLTRGFQLHREPSARYRITLETGREPGAGTTGSILVRLLGHTDCHLVWLPLNGPTEDLESGARRRYGPYTYIAHDPPTDLEVRLGGMSADSDRWQLLRVAVEDTATGRTWVAEPDTWFDWTSPQQTFPLSEKD
ncbi:MULTISPECIES: hypothetical protein [unclassified Nocardia]|uniref:hypothetical protein n=1 Tax=unclassified Nocardia TaxID=2637762 RepID=UPI0024A95551|nr:MULTISPECIES: hypothetical protein [unclassified Nocardia]